MNTDKLEVDLNPQPRQPLALRTIWPQLASGLIFVVALIWSLFAPSQTTGILALGAGLLFALTVAYLYSIQRGWRAITSSLTWIGGVVLALYTVIVVPSFVIFSGLFLFAAVSYGLGASGRRTMLWGSVVAWLTLMVTLVLYVLNDAGIISIGLAKPLPSVSAALAIVCLLLSGDIFQRLWRHYNRTQKVFSQLQQTNHTLSETQTKLERNVKAQAELLDVSRVINSTLELDPLLEEILIQLKRVIAYGSTTVYVIRNGALTALRHTGHFSGQITSIASVFTQTPQWQKLIQEQKPQIVGNLSDQPDFYQPFMQALGDDVQKLRGQIRAWMGVPLIVRGQVIGALSLTHAEAYFFDTNKADLAFAFANHAAVAIEAARAREEAVASATLAERHRLARELHDSVSQALFGMVLSTRTALELLEQRPAQAQASMRYTLDLADAALNEMRALIFELRPESLKEDGLLAAFRKQAAALVARHKLNLQLDLCEEEPAISLDAKEALYRISMEALQNTLRHAHASKLHVILTCHSERLVLDVTDNGSGFDPTAEFPGHLGLRTMRERAEAFGGTIDIDSRTGYGTRVRIIMPTQSTTKLPAGITLDSVALHAAQTPLMDSAITTG